MSQRKSGRRVRDPLACIPPSECVQERLDRIFTEAAKLQKILVLAREIEAAKASDVSDIPSDPSSDQEGQK